MRSLPTQSILWFCEIALGVTLLPNTNKPQGKLEELFVCSISTLRQIHCPITPEGPFCTHWNCKYGAKKMPGKKNNFKHKLPGCCFIPVSWVKRPCLWLLQKIAGLEFQVNSQKLSKNTITIRRAGISAEVPFWHFWSLWISERLLFYLWLSEVIINIFFQKAKHKNKCKSLCWVKF